MNVKQLIAHTRKPAAPVTDIAGLTEADCALYMRLVDAIRFCANGAYAGMKFPEIIITEAALNALRPIIQHKRNAAHHPPGAKP